MPKRTSPLLSLAEKPKILFPLLLLATLFLAFGARQLSIQNDIMFMLPDSNAEKLFFLETQEKFGSGTGIAIAISSEKGIYDPLLLEKIQKAGDRIRNANQTIPARILEKRFSLGPSEALLITAFSQRWDTQFVVLFRIFLIKSIFSPPVSDLERAVFCFVCVHPLDLYHGPGFPDRFKKPRKKIQGEREPSPPEPHAAGLAFSSPEEA